jgi:hypothetical protein
MYHAYRNHHEGLAGKKALFMLLISMHPSCKPPHSSVLPFFLVKTNKIIGIGVYMLLPCGVRAVSLSQCIGSNETCNVAEYKALLAGMNLALSYGAASRDVEVHV